MQEPAGITSRCISLAQEPVGERYIRCSPPAKGSTGARRARLPAPNKENLQREHGWPDVGHPCSTSVWASDRGLPNPGRKTAFDPRPATLYIIRKHVPSAAGEWRGRPCPKRDGSCIDPGPPDSIKNGNWRELEPFSPSLSGHPDDITGTFWGRPAKNRQICQEKSRKSS